MNGGLSSRGMARAYGRGRRRVREVLAARASTQSGGEQVAPLTAPNASSSSQQELGRSVAQALPKNKDAKICAGCGGVKPAGIMLCARCWWNAPSKLRESYCYASDRQARVAAVRAILESAKLARPARSRKS